MKKILQLIVFLVFANNAMAQLRTVDLEISNLQVMPSTSFTNITPQDTITVMGTFRNNGPDTLYPSDQLKIFYYYGLKDTSSTNNGILGMLSHMNIQLAPGDEFYAFIEKVVPFSIPPDYPNVCACFLPNTIDTFFACVISEDIYDPDVDTSFISYPLLAQMGSNNLSIRPVYFYSTGGGGTSLPQTDNNFEKSNALQLYPNPTQNAVNFDFVAKQLAKVEINIYDVSGKRVMHEAFQSKTSEKQTFSQSVNNLPKNNLYIVELSIDGLKKQAKLYLQ